MVPQPASLLLLLHIASTWASTGGSSQLAKPAAIGGSELLVKDSQSFSTGQTIRINPRGANAEDAIIGGFGGGVRPLQLQHPLSLDHSAREEVVAIDSAAILETVFYIYSPVEQEGQTKFLFTAMVDPYKGFDGVRVANLRSFNFTSDGAAALREAEESKFMAITSYAVSAYARLGVTFGPNVRVSIYIDRYSPASGLFMTKDSTEAMMAAINLHTRKCYVSFVREGEDGFFSKWSLSDFKPAGQVTEFESKLLKCKRVDEYRTVLFTADPDLHVDEDLLFHPIHKASYYIDTA